jgi:dipeptidyl-peptidase 4
MAPDGSKIVFGWNKTGIRKVDMWIMDYPSGSPKMILEAEKVDRLPRQDDERTDLQKEEEAEYDGGLGGGFIWAPDSKEILFGYRGRTWLIKPDGSDLRPLFNTSESVGSPAFSPDGKYISFVRGQNLFRLDRKTGEVKQLTFLSKSGTNLDGYYWSPDSKTIAVSWSASRFGSHSMMDFTHERARVVGISRMWNGEGGIDVQLGMVPADGGIIKFAKNTPRYVWLTDIQWAPDSSRVGVYWIDQSFKEATITLIDRDADRRVVYEEKAPSNYIPDFRSLLWARDSKSLMFTTDIIDGKWANRSLLAVDLWGLKVSKVYAENHDIASVTRPKNSDRLIFVTQKRNPLITEITIKEPDGSIKTHIPVETGAAVPNAFDDATIPMVSEDGTRIASLVSHRAINPELYSIEPSIKRLTVSQTPEFEKVQWADVELVQFPGPDGKMIHGAILTKPGLDKTKKHPAVISDMYANSAKQSWGGYNANYMAVELGMVVMLIDFRASWGYGGEFNSGYYKSMGVIDTQEAIKGKEYLVNRGFVRPDRVGVWGWSYGGYLTCMIMLTGNGAFDTGVAVASVTDWVTYNEWYTRRRLGLPKDDKDIYKKTSPVHHAKGLQGNLLLVHGMLDDNVLYQDTVRLQENLIKEGKYFDTFAYPRGDHGMFRVHERPHVMTTIVSYLYNKLSRP